MDEDNVTLNFTKEQACQIASALAIYVADLKYKIKEKEADNLNLIPLEGLKRRSKLLQNYSDYIFNEALK